MAVIGDCSIFFERWHLCPRLLYVWVRHRAVNALAVQQVGVADIPRRFGGGAVVVASGESGPTQRTDVVDVQMRADAGDGRLRMPGRVGGI